MAPTRIDEESKEFLEEDHVQAIAVCLVDAMEDGYSAEAIMKAAYEVFCLVRDGEAKVCVTYLVDPDELEDDIDKARTTRSHER